jgi:hypothetical protein
MTFNFPLSSFSRRAETGSTHRAPSHVVKSPAAAGSAKRQWWVKVQAALLTGALVGSSVFGTNLILEQPARAQSAPSRALGAIDPVTRFPAWYRDASGTSLELCLDGAPNCLAAATDITPGATGATGEAFYFNANSTLTTSGGNSLLVLGTEAAFTNGAPARGEESVFNRTRVRVQTKNPGSHTVVWPYGQKTYSVAKVDSKTFEINETVDLGCFSAPTNTCADGKADDFNVVLNSLNPFLKWDAGAPAGFLGDAATPHRVVGGTEKNPDGSPINVFRVLGPGINPNDKVDGCPTLQPKPTGYLNANCIETPLFVVQGKLAKPLASDPASTTDFGTHDLNSTTAQVVTFKNIGLNPLKVGTATVAPTTDFATGADSCTKATLALDQSCTVEVKFTPTAGGRRTASLTLTHDQPRSPTTVTLVGSGLSQAAISLSPSALLPFGPIHVGALSDPQRLTVTNTSDPTTGGPLNISTIALSGPNSIDFGFSSQPDSTRANCVGTAIAPGQTCLIDVRFTPFESGTLTASLDITSDAGVKPLSVAVSGTSTPGLVETGPIVPMGPDPAHPSSFPAWYRDAGSNGGLRLVPCLDGLPTCFAALADLTAPDGEAFWMGADALIDLPNNHRARLVLSTEAAYAGAGQGQEITFNRIRMTTDAGALKPNQSYKVTHPYGVDIYTTDAAGSLRPNATTQDIGCLAAPCYNSASPNDGSSHFGELMSSRIGPFLRWSSSGAGDEPPLGYVGDGNTPHKVTGGMNGNIFRIEGPDIAGPGQNSIETNLFTLQGKILGPGPIVTSPPADTYSGPQQVTLSTQHQKASNGQDITDDTNVEIHYTTDGVTEPTRTSPLASGPITISSTTTIKAVAINAAGGISRTPAAGITITIGAAQPKLTASPAAGSYNTAQKVTLTADQANSKIFYTVDGSTPNVAANGQNGSGTVLYTAPVAIDTTTTLKAIAVNPVGLSSTEFTAVYNIASGPEAVGSVDPANGFPTYYQDNTGLRLQLCLDQSALCLAQVPNAGQPLSFPGNFPDESFYWNGTVVTTTVDGKPAKLVLATEGTFAPVPPATVSVPAANQQITFGRIKFTVSSLKPGGVYRVTHPYGVETVVADQTTGDLKFQQDVGCGAAPCTFGSALGSRITTFLRWDTNDAPAGFVGDPAVEHTVTGSPFNTNIFKVEEINPVDSSVIKVWVDTDKFFIQGKLAGAPVSASPKGGSFSAAQTVSLATSDSAVRIYYTVDGSKPTTSSSLYSAPITLNATTTLKAISVNAAGVESPVMTEVYVIDALPPTITASPLGGSFGAVQTLSVTLSSDKTGTKIFYTIDGKTTPSPSDGTGTTHAYTAPLTLAAGTTTLKYMGVDASGNASVVSTQTYVIGDATPPTVAITAPADGASVSGTLPVTVNATDNVAVVSVQYQVDNIDLGAAVTTAPFGTTWTTTSLTNGSHTLTAVAKDAAGNSSAPASVTVTVANDKTAPTVSFTAPAVGASVSGTVPVTVDAADNVGVVSVQYQLDGANLGTAVTTSPFSTSWNTTGVSNGSHTLTAVAKDAAGNSSTLASVTVTVSNTVADTTVPTVSITAPTAGAPVSGANVTLTATASDNVGVASVQFQVDGANVNAADTTAPYSVTWDSTTVANGSHTISAVAKDAAGNTSTPASVTVTVSNTAAAAKATLNPTSLAFQNTRANSTSTVNVSVTNSGTAPLTFGATGDTAISGTNATNFRVSNDNCAGKSVNPGASCTITVSFTPTLRAPATTLTAILSVTDNAGKQTVALSGKGV